MTFSHPLAASQSMGTLGVGGPASSASATLSPDARLLFFFPDARLGFGASATSREPTESRSKPPASAAAPPPSEAAGGSSAAGDSMVSGSGALRRRAALSSDEVAPSHRGGSAGASCAACERSTEKKGSASSSTRVGALAAVGAGRKRRSRMAHAAPGPGMGAPVSMICAHLVSSRSVSWELVSISYSKWPKASTSRPTLKARAPGAGRGMASNTPKGDAPSSESSYSEMRHATAPPSSLSMNTLPACAWLHGRPHARRKRKPSSTCRP
mmetsp:Transcript_72728/g.193312  ORF Transcript_72728/g.193312 Transcript_72728/m.193312 type:complete len:269 (-) Transcript_72728:31-837(-)